MTTATQIDDKTWLLLCADGTTERVTGATSAADAERIFHEARNPPDTRPIVTVDDYVAAIEQHIDAVAHAKSYSGALSLASYVNSTLPQWAAEAAAFIAWRDAVWMYAYAEFAEVQSGQRSQPTLAEIIAELPSITWPA